MRHASRKIAGFSVALLGLTGCYEDLITLDDDEEPGGVIIPGVVTTIEGAVAKGYAYCDVIAREPVGTALSETAFRPAGIVVGQNNQVNAPIPQPTAADVAFTLTVEDYVGPIVIEATNCTYEDETTALETNLSMLRTVINIPEQGGSLNIVITPITEIAYNVAVARADGVQQGITSGGVEAAQRLVTNAFTADGQFDPMTTLPAIASMEGAAEAADDAMFHGLVLASLSGVGTILDELYDGLSDDLSSVGLREFYGAIEEGAVIFDESGRNQADRTALSVWEEVTAAALNPEDDES